MLTLTLHPSQLLQALGNVNESPPLSDVTDEDETNLQDTVILSRFLKNETIDNVLNECCGQDKLGNNTAMTAVKAKNKEILVILLGYFLEAASDAEHLKKINEILHQTNKGGQNLMSIVMAKDDCGTAQNMLVKLESMVHEGDEHQFEICMFKHLGTNKRSLAAMKFFEKTKDSIPITRVCICSQL